MAPNLLLETHNRVVYARVLERVTNSNPDKKKFNEVLADFNKSLWLIAKTKETFTVSAMIPCWAELKENRAMEYLQEVYGDIISESEDQNWNVTLTIPETVEKPEEFAMKCAKLLTNMLMAPAVIVAKEVKEGKASDKLIQINYRPGEAYWLKPKDDRLTIIFSIRFEDKDDAVFGRVFISEFSKGMQGAPACDVVTRKGAPAPRELEGAEGLQEDSCYISFLMEKRHLNNPPKTLEQMMTCRNYINFHLKCSKAFLHIRMRNKVQQMQLVLNRSKPERQVEKKTASGRTFKK